jgi:4-amino-4-deoxy-L-arabinose transferase-like glycosyltransferase
MNKHTILFALVLLVGGLLCTRDRVLLLNRHAVYGALLAMAIWAPNLWWQLDNGVPALDMSEAIRERNGGALGGLPDFALETVALWAVFGLVIAWWGGRWLLRDAEGRRFRALAVGAVLVVPLVALSGGKSYYAAPLALLLVPAATVAIEADASRRRSFLTIVIVGGAIGSLAALPLLPADRLDALAEVQKEYGEMIGWQDLAAQVGAVHAGLAPEERARAVIFTSDYGEAGALELYGPDHGLPPVYSGHNSYADWAVPADDAGPAIVVGIPPERLPWCVDPEQVATVTNDVGIDNDEAGEPIVVCHQLTDTWSNLWPSLEHVN